VTADSRDRVTVDLRGLAPAVKAHASARHMTLAAFARAAMVEALKHAEDDPLDLSRDSSLHDRQPVKLTLTLPLRQAVWLVEHARAAGLSYGAYLASVIDGTPAPVGLRDAARALTASTNELAALGADLNDYARLLRRKDFEGAEQYRQRVVSMFDEVRQHVRLHAALATEVKAAVRWKPQRPNPS
jgi:hypothetical protein